MSDGKVSVTMPEATVETIDEEADQLGMSRAEYIRQHLHAGRRLFQSSGKLDRQLLEALVDGDESAHLSDDLTTDASGIEDDILTNLPRSEDRALSREELREAVFGTLDEQLEQVNDALKYLRERDRVAVNLDSEVYIDE